MVLTSKNKKDNVCENFHIERHGIECFEVDGVMYKIISSMSKTVEVTFKSNDYNSYAGDVNIPSKVSYDSEDYVVVGVSSYAFYRCVDLTS